MDIQETNVKSILTRTGGYLKGVVTHSLQPYRGCSYGNALCGVGCYVQHNHYVTAGQPWGGFLDVRTNAAEVYRRQYRTERNWARSREGRFAIFCSSATDPFVPQERTYGITASLLDAMLDLPPDILVLQTHSHRVTDELERIVALAERCELRVHVSIETDRERIEGLPPHASSVARRLEAAGRLHSAGVGTVVTVAPLLPIADPEAFFERIASVADAVVIDHFIEGDGSRDGSRTRKTILPVVMRELEPGSDRLEYRDRMVRVARAKMPGRVGVGGEGFAGRFA